MELFWYMFFLYMPCSKDMNPESTLIHRKDELMVDRADVISISSLLLNFQWRTGC